MSHFYRDRRGFFGSLFRNGGWYLALAATALVVIGLFAVLVSPGGDAPAEVYAASDTDGRTAAAEPTDRVDGTDAAASEPLRDTEVVAAADPEPVREVTLSVPVEGTLGTGFSLTVPVFSETMKDWRVHQGIDYLTDEPTDVFAAADGVVEGVYVSELMGLTVELRHADGTVTLYQSLSGDPAVSAGQTVRRGDRIGATGKSADCEHLIGCHLHFAVLKNGVFQDPNDRFGS